MVQEETHILYVMDVQSLRHPFPVGSRINSLVRCAAHRGGMGRDYLLIKPEHGIISGQMPSVVLLGSVDMHPAWSYP